MTRRTFAVIAALLSRGRAIAAEVRKPMGRAVEASPGGFSRTYTPVRYGMSFTVSRSLLEDDALHQYLANNLAQSVRERHEWLVREVLRRDA
jgi:hypothetical protein